MTLLTSLLSSWVSARRDQGEADAALGTGTTHREYRRLRSDTRAEPREELSAALTSLPVPLQRWDFSQMSAGFEAMRALGDEKPFEWKSEQRQVACL